MKRRGEKEPWMDAADYGRSLKGFGVNLLVRDVARSAAFLSEVLELEEVYSDVDFAVLRYAGHDVIVHADHTYSEHPLLGLTGDNALRGVGVELRVYGVDPDAAEARARARGDTVLAASADKPHGLREAYLVDPDGYVWVPGAAIQP